MDNFYRYPQRLSYFSKHLPIKLTFDIGPIFLLKIPFLNVILRSGLSLSKFHGPGAFIIVPSKFSVEAKMCVNFISISVISTIFISCCAFSVAAGCFPPSSTTQAPPPNKTAVSMNSQTVVIIASVTAVIFLVICIVLTVVFVVRYVTQLPNIYLNLYLKKLGWLMWMKN